ncbi:FecR family protein [Chryseobacterium sp. c4a]|uniref:FecR family protein n=1 Tax=Chryseobacterium sp. c4a TaxID=1573582 RepID=UPI00135A1166|nr:FecR family protein [Chryseobacterium sp. c4a]
MNRQNPNMPPPTEDELQQMWSRITNEVKKRRQRRTRIRLAVSASVVILLTLSGVMYYDMQIRDDVYYAESADKKIILVDGSEITLSKGARLTVEKTFPSDTREVYLEGDAIFKVSKSKVHPFVVHGNGYETRVLGTVFKVVQKGKTFSVDLFEGKVSVYRKEKPSEYFVLQPKETFSNMGAKEIATVMKTEHKTDPSTSKDLKIDLNFTECPFELAIQTIEKNYGLKIIYPLELGQEDISITHHGNAEQIIKAIALQYNLNTKKINATTFEFEK